MKPQPEQPGDTNKRTKTPAAGRREQVITAVLFVAVAVAGVLAVALPANRPQALALTGVAASAAQALKAAGPAPVVKFSANKDSAPSIDKPALVNLNSASQAELEALPYIGPTLAANIIAARPFQSLSEVDSRVKGIGPKMLERLKGYISL
jgi:DNA uptake protein ComE-like DNA-binding protein